MLQKIFFSGGGVAFGGAPGYTLYNGNSDFFQI
ncbi:hypothetical protein APLC1_3281 [Limnospira platensis C1]|nr:hypothetical protein APLC1_3281 [Arthrospira platensis C1]